MEVLGKCHAQLGPSLVDFLEGLKPAQLMALEEHFRMIRYDTRGHGASPVPAGPYSIDDLADDELLQLAAQQRNLDLDPAGDRHP